MTKDTLSDNVALRALLSETSDTHLLVEMLGFVADRLMALDVDQLCGGGTHERSADRVNHRNGYRSRAWETRAGRVDVKIPKLRKGSCFPVFLEPRRVAEKAMTAVIQEAYAKACRHDRRTIWSRPRTYEPALFIQFGWKGYLRLKVL